MKLTLHRIDDRRHWTAIERADGASFEVRGIGFMGALPHDLAHFVVETELGLANGFWGSVAAGAIFDSMKPVAGQRPFHADAKSAALIKANQDDLNDCELLVGAFTEAVGKGLPHVLLALGRFQKAGAVKNALVTPADALRVHNAMLASKADWLAMPLGSAVTMAWAEGGRRKVGRRA